MMKQSLLPGTVGVLSASDFRVGKLNQNDSRQILALNPKSTWSFDGVCIVLFHSDRCPNCPSMIKLIQSKANEVPSIRFFTFNITAPGNHQVISASANCTNKIEYVPDVIVFVNRLPLRRYNTTDPKNSSSDSFNTFLADLGRELSRGNNQLPTVSPCMLNKNNSTQNPQIECNKDGVCYIKPYNGKKMKQYKNQFGFPYSVTCTDTQCYLTLDGKCKADSKSHLCSDGGIDCTLISESSLAQIKMKQDAARNTKPASFM